MDFQVNRQNLRQCRFEPQPPLVPAQGEALLHIERYAFTANNITYAVFGEAMAYWSFFPAPAGWGRIPVWGYARVAQSRCEGLQEGERVFGYLPMSREVLLRPQRLAATHFSDGSAHRLALPAAYQHYTRLASSGDALHEDLAALWRPLFMTAFLIEDFLADNVHFGAQSVLLSSASSKTALGLAQRIRARGACSVVGLTSTRNLAFCRSTGYYDEVCDYRDLGALPASTPSIFVDMAGNGTLLHDIHHHYRDALRYSCMVGGTHWEQRSTQHGLPGAKPAFFFAPTQYKKRAADWGAGGVESRFEAAWQALRPSVQSWMQVQRGSGNAAIEQLYRQTLEGEVPPQYGHLLGPPT